MWTSWTAYTDVKTITWEAQIWTFERFCEVKKDKIWTFEHF